jgi:hypothetical protein
MASVSWLVLKEMNGTVVLSVAASLDEGIEECESLLRPSATPPAEAAGVVMMDHALRAAQVTYYRRQGQRKGNRETQELPSAVPGAYDALCGFGIDIEREILSGRPPSAEKIATFVRLLGIPVILERKSQKFSPRKGDETKANRNALRRGRYFPVCRRVSAIYF